MRSLMENALKQLSEFFKRMSKRERIRFGILAAIVIVLAIVTVSILGRTSYETLLNTQDVIEAGEIFSAIQDMGIPVRAQGTRILVPEGRSDEVRLMLANQGFFSYEPNLEIYDAASGFGTTDDHRQRILDIGMAMEIRQQILISPKIQNANVIINSGRISSFARGRGEREPVATVMLELRGVSQLTQQEAQTIAEMVRTTVSGISYDNITITDSNLKTYNIVAGSEDIGTELGSRFELQNQLAQQIQRQAEDLLIPIFGMNMVKIQANVTLDFDSVIIERIEFEPPIAGEMEGMIRSAMDLFEVQRTRGAAIGIPGTDENLNPPGYPYGPLGEDEEYRKILNERNMELNQTITSIEEAKGRIRYLSISVLIDPSAVTEDYTAEVRDLVSMGFGANPANVAVAMIEFNEHGQSLAEMYAEWEAQLARERQRELLEIIIQWAVILLLGIMFMSLVRTIVRVIKGETEPELALAGGGIDYIADDELDDGFVQDEEIELTTKSSSLEQIEKFIEKDPGAVAQLLRNWLTDE